MTLVNTQWLTPMLWKEWGYKKLPMFRRSSLEIQHLLELWYLHSLVLCHRHNTLLSFKVFWLTMWAECFSSFFAWACLGFLRSLGSPLILGLLSPLRMFVSPSQIVPSQITVGEHHYPLHWGAGTHTPPRSYFGHSPLPPSPPHVIWGCGPIDSSTAAVQSYSLPVDSESTSCC